MSTLEVEADVSESSLAKIKLGQPCEIVLDALPDTRFRARSADGTTVDRAKATVMSKIRFNELDPRILRDERESELLSQEVVPAAEPLKAVNPDALTSAMQERRFVIRDTFATEVPLTKGASWAPGGSDR